MEKSKTLLSAQDGIDKFINLLKNISDIGAFIGWLLFYVLMVISILTSIIYLATNNYENIAILMFRLIKLTFWIFICSFVVYLYYLLVKWASENGKKRALDRRIKFKSELKKEILEEIKSGRNSFNKAR
jgi:hypothetical protein